MKTVYAAALCATAMAASPALATTSFDLTATVLNGAYAGDSFIGSITYDETLLTGIDEEDLAPVGSTVPGVTPDAAFAIAFTDGVNSLNETDDFDYPNFPIFSFFEGDLVGIEFEVDFLSASFDLLDLGILAFFFEDDLAFDGVGYSIGVDVFYIADIPLPAGLPLLVGGLAGFAALRRRQSS